MEAKQERASEVLRKSGGVWIALWKDSFFRWTCILFGATTIFQFLPILTDSFVYGFYLHLLLLSIIAIQYRLQRVTHMEERRFWHLLTVAYLFWFAARCLYRLIGDDRWTRQMDLATDLLYIGFYLGLFLALSSRPHLYYGWSRRNRLFIIESIGGVVFIFAILTYFVLIPLNLESTTSGVREPSFYMYVLLDVLLAMMILNRWTHCKIRRWKLLYTLLSIVILLVLVSDLLQGLTQSTLLPLLERGSFLDRVWRFCWATQFPVVIAAARIREIIPISRDQYAEIQPVEEQRTVRIRRFSLIFYILALPIMHLVFNGLGLLDPAGLFPRDLTVLFCLVVLGFAAFLHQNRLERERRRAELTQEVLLEVSRKADLTKDLTELIRLVRNSLGRIFDTSNFFIALYDPDKDEYSTPFAADESDTIAEFTQEQFRKSLTSYVIRTGQPLVADPETISRLEKEGEIQVTGTVAQSWLGVPLRSSNGIIGVVVIQNYRRGTGYSAFDLQLMDIVSRRIALEIERKKNADDLKQSREQLQLSLAWLEGILEGTRDGIFVSDVESRFISVNKAACRITGYSREELLQMQILDLQDEHDLGTFQKYRSRVLAGEYVVLETKMLRKDGAYRPVEVANTRIRISDRVYMLTAARDLSDRKALEEQLLQAQKMEAVGRLAGGIAHDFNNLLTVIAGHTDLAMFQLGSEHPVLENLEEVQQASQRAESLVQQLLTFSRKQTSETRVFDANHVLSQIERMLLRLIGEDIHLEFNAAEGPLLIEVDRGQFEQTILNLVVNSRDAMPHGGEILIETKFVHLEIPDTVHNVGPGDWVVVSVADTGHGMDEETCCRIFEPFFTTKEVGKGTGLGLAIVYGIVSQNGGQVFVESSPSRGTKFRLYFPSVESQFVK